MSTTRLQEVLIAFGKGKQTDIATAQLSEALWRFTKLNGTLANPKLTTENDAPEYGKGHEFATVNYKTSWDVSGSLEKYLAAEIAAWAVAFALGKVVLSGSAPSFTYTCTPLMPANGDPAELPYFSYVEQIRPGAGVVAVAFWAGFWEAGCCVGATAVLWVQAGCSGPAPSMGTR